MYGSMNDWFQMGRATSPVAGMGDAIRGVLGMHEKLTMQAGQTGMDFQAKKQLSDVTGETALRQAQTRHYGALSDWYGNLGAEGEGMTPESEPIVKTFGNQQFYWKPTGYKGKQTGGQWTPITQNILNMFPGGLLSPTGNNQNVPPGINADDWNRASPAQQQEYLDWAKANARK